jgi:hypothetical protein
MTIGYGVANSSLGKLHPITLGLEKSYKQTSSKLRQIIDFHSSRANNRDQKATRNLFKVNSNLKLIN